MYEKFRLEDSDEKAEIHFLNILEESVTALFAKFNDIIHRWASYWRKWNQYKYIFYDFSLFS